MNTLKMTLAFGVCAAALTFETAHADDETAAPRNLKWVYAGEAFEDPANWTWAEESTEAITAGPRDGDSVRFYGLATADAEAVKTLKLSANVAVSNFNYSVKRTSGQLVVDLGGNALTVLGNMNLTTDRAYLNTDGITFRDGTVRVTGSATGTKNSFSQMNEDFGGFYVNLPGNSYAGLNCVLDHTVLDISSRNLPMVAYHSTGGDRGAAGAFCRTNHFTLVNGSEIRASRFTFNVQNVNAPTHAIVDVQNSKMTIYDETMTSNDHTFNMLTCQGGGTLDMRFREGGSLEAGQIKARVGMSFLFDGGNHVLHGAFNWGDDEALYLSGSRLTVANGAILDIQKGAKIQNGTVIEVRGKASLSCTKANTGFSVGVHYNYLSTEAGLCSVVVDGGLVSFPLITFGQAEAYGDNRLSIAGPLSRVEQTQANLYGFPAGLAFNYGTQIAFEIPAEGYHDADGVARAPVYSAGAFRSTTTENCRPISLALATRTFDRANPKKSVTLLQAASDSRAVFETLIENVTWTDNPHRHGTLSVSDDGTCLVYTTGAKQGLAVIIR